MNTLDIMHKGKPTYLGILISDFCYGDEIPWSSIPFISKAEIRAAVQLEKRERQIRWFLVRDLDHKMPAHRN